MLSCKPFHYRYGSLVVGDSFLNTSLTTQTLTQTYILISIVNMSWDLPKSRWSQSRSFFSNKSRSFKYGRKMLKHYLIMYPKELEIIIRDRPYIFNERSDMILLGFCELSLGIAIFVCE